MLCKQRLSPRVNTSGLYTVSSPKISLGVSPAPRAVRHRRGVADPLGMVGGHIRVWASSASCICGRRQWGVISGAQGSAEHAQPHRELAAAPMGCPTLPPPCRRVRGSSCSGRHRDVLLSFPCTSMSSGVREGGQRAASSLILPSSTHSPVCIPLLQALLGDRRDRATPIPDGEGQLG